MIQIANLLIFLYKHYNDCTLRKEKRLNYKIGGHRDGCIKKNIPSNKFRI